MAPGLNELRQQTLKSRWLIVSLAINLSCAPRLSNVVLQNGSMAVFLAVHNPNSKSLSAR